MVEDARPHPGLLRRLGTAYRVLALIGFNTLLVIACLELAATAVLMDQDEAHDERADLAYYRAVPWGAAYWQEFSASEQEAYAPYLTWRRPPFDGEFITVDGHGRRVTPGAKCGPDAYTVYTFGGSTMWGTGAPDDATIPAFLQAELAAARTGPVCVVNFAESAYVSTQSVIALLLELRAGRVPDLVVFYDGINDTYAAYQSGHAGGHHNETSIASRFEGERGPMSRVVELVRRWQDDPSATYATRGVDASELAQAVMAAYLGNIDLVDGLSGAYGFEVAFFWQPVIAVSAKPLTSEEQRIRSGMDPALVTLTEAVYAAVREQVPDTPHLHYLGDLFDAEPAFTWIDMAHITPEGNRRVAQAMLAALDG